jgi:hypothetical protein
VTGPSGAITGTFKTNDDFGLATQTLVTIPGLGTVTGGAPTNNHICSVQFTNTSSNLETVTGVHAVLGAAPSTLETTLAPGASVFLLDTGSTIPASGSDGWGDVAVIDESGGVAAQLETGFSIQRSASGVCTTNAAALG